jgi:hypothetical protein
VQKHNTERQFGKCRVKTQSSIQSAMLGSFVIFSSFIMWISVQHLQAPIASLQCQQWQSPRLSSVTVNWFGILKWLQFILLQFWLLFSSFPVFPAVCSAFVLMSLDLSCCSVGRPALREADALHSSSCWPAAGGQVSSGRLPHWHHHLGERQVTISLLILFPGYHSSKYPNLESVTQTGIIYWWQRTGVIWYLKYCAFHHPSIQIMLFINTYGVCETVP